MRIGCNIDTYVGRRDQPVPSPRDAARAIESIVEEGIAAERAGFHSIRVPERHGRTDCYVPGPLQLLTLLARETHRVALGAYVLVNTLYHPMLIAEQCSVIDNLSRGRLFMTWARGGKDYWGYFGVPRERMLGRFLENVEVIERAYSGDRFSFHGDFYDVEDALLTPLPYQRPRFPFWGGGSSPASIRRCASYAEAWGCGDYPIDPKTWEEKAGSYREAAADKGKVPFIVLSRNAWVADSYEKALEEYGPAYVEQFGGRRYTGEVKPADVGDDIVIGSPAQCIERLEYFEKELGIDYLTLRFRLPTGTPFGAVKDQIVRFGEEVVSHFHRRDTATIHPAIPEGARW